MTEDKAMSLKEELANLFNDNDLSESMMYGECHYDPKYPIRAWNRETKTYELTGETKIAKSGYAEDLERAGIGYESVDSFGGEGQGDQYWHVWKFTRDGEEVLVKFYGWYASYVGAEFTDWSFVTPKKVEVIQYV